MNGKDLRLLKILYWDFNDHIQEGELIVHRIIVQEVLDIFQELLKHHFNIDKMKPIDVYGGDDVRSMEDNNSSAYNYRVVAGESRLSNHSYGLAIDINPIQNPYIKNGVVLPLLGKQYIDRNIIEKGMIKESEACYRAFHNRGWIWGGAWEGKKDYHHFEKKVEGIN